MRGTWEFGRTGLRTCARMHAVGGVRADHIVTAWDGLRGMMCEGDRVAAGGVGRTTGRAKTGRAFTDRETHCSVGTRIVRSVHAVFGRYMHCSVGTRGVRSVHAPHWGVR